MRSSSLQHSTYHRVLRVSAVVCAFVLIWVSGVISETTAQLSNNTGLYLANAVGMTASVKPTELNQYTAALTQKERELDAREAALNEREIEVTISGGEGTSAGANDTATYLLAGVLFIMLVLIVLNYVLDFLRERQALLEERPV